MAPTSSRSSVTSSNSYAQKNDEVDERAPLLSYAQQINPQASLEAGRLVDETAVSASSKCSSSSDEPTTSNKEIISILAVLLIGALLANADFSIALATHALIASEFNDLSNSSWIFVSFGLAATAAQPLIGKLSDIYGRKSVLLISYALFTIGCAIIGIAPSLSIVVLGRVLSGIGCAGMSALVSIIITDLVPLRDVASWRSYVNIISTTGRSLGGPVGGWFADTIGWRWTFLVQVPVMVLASALTWLLVPSQMPQRGSATPPPTPSTPSQSKPKRFARLDVAGSLLLALTVLLVMFPLELGGQKIAWTHPLIPSLLVASLVAGTLFVRAERRAAEPVMPLSLFGNRDFVIAFVVAALQIAAQSSMMVTVPLYFQITAGDSATRAGAQLLPAVVGNAVSQLLAGAYITRVGRYKGLVSVGTMCTSVCYLLLLLRWNGATGVGEGLYIVPGGFGTGIACSALFIALTAAVEPEFMAIASSSMYLSTSIGSVVGMAGSSAAVQTLVHQGLKTVVAPGVEDREEFVRRCLEDLEFIQQLKGSLREKVVGVYLLGFRGAYIMSLILSVLGTLMGLFLRERSLA